jgi:hypothetical protein
MNGGVRRERTPLTNGHLRAVALPLGHVDARAQRSPRRLAAGEQLQAGADDRAQRNAQPSRGRACHLDAGSGYTLYGETRMKYNEGRLHERLAHG